MTQRDLKGILFIGSGMILIIFGTMMSLSHRSTVMAISGSICIVAGLILSRLSNLNRGINGNSGLLSKMPFLMAGGRGSRRPFGVLETISYTGAVLLLLAVVGSALSGYFNDILTYSFAAVFLIAILFWFTKRVL